MRRAKPTTLVSTYLSRLHEVHATQRQTPELSYRGALENLLNAVGSQLDPAVQATGELSDTGAGHPDFGFFEVKSGNARGGVEVKPFEEDVPHTADGSQVSRYVRQYGYILVTNYRDFLLVVRNGNAKAVVEGRCTLATSADAFWDRRLGALAKEKGEELVDFLIGVIKRSAPITRPVDLADDLARHAREAKRRLERHDITALAPLKEAMENALGLHFAGREGEDFFRSSLVQTLFYGLFSGWMLWREGRHRPGTFDWKDASEHLALPLIGNLYEEIARPRRLADLNLREPLDWSTASLNRVDEDTFFKDFDQNHAITLFYEPFLKAFDPELRKQLGVWYTPPEIVQYMVGRVDQLLRSELGIDNGLADDSVYVLDPCCGTGSYLLEVARRIHQTLLEQGHGQVAALQTRKALTTRVFGFEILPAPYVVSHLQLGVMLRQIGTKLAPTQRAGVYLTNALTGWEPPKGPKQTLAFPFLEEEQEAATKVKRESPILVILGNPPYNRFAGVAEDEEADLIEPYKDGLYTTWGIRKQLLDDLYVRFFRLAEKRIAEVGGVGIVCYISNYSWLDGLSHPIMRERLLHQFDAVWVDNCNGDKYRTGKRTPEGLPDESMFTTDEHRVGIQVGTAIASLVRRRGTRARAAASVLYRDLWGSGNAKRSELLHSLGGPRHHRYQNIPVRKESRWVLAATAQGADYRSWVRLPELLPVHFSGLNENRLSTFIGIARDDIARRMHVYFDSSVEMEELAERLPGVNAQVAGYDPEKVRRSMLAARHYDERRIVPLAYRPLDNWWTYWEGEYKLFNRPRPDFFKQVWPGNLFIAASQTGRKGGLKEPVIVEHLGDLHLQDPWSQFFPLFIRVEGDLHGSRCDPNLSDAVLESLCATQNVPAFSGTQRHWSDAALALTEHVFYHLLAILWSPAYRKENEAALRQDWPRVPIPADASILEASAALGRTVADLLLPDKPVRGVTTGKLRDELKTLAVPSKKGGGPIEEPDDTRVEAGWGFHGQRNAVMCGKGIVTEDKKHRDALNVWINDRVYWSNVPSDVWAMTIGGYPVVKKWLSYREHKVLGRALKGEELTYVTEVVRRLKALLLLGKELDSNYRAAAKAPQVGSNAPGSAAASQPTRKSRRRAKS